MSALHLTRREVLEMALVLASAVTVSGGQTALAGPIPGPNPDQFPARGTLTLLHLTDCHGQLLPLYAREPETNPGVGSLRGKPPHLTNAALLAWAGIPPGGVEAYLCTAPNNFGRMALEFGPVGGFAHLATLVQRIREERGAGNVLLLDGGDSWQGSYGALVTQGREMIRACKQLGVEAMVPHWELTHGADVVRKQAERLPFQFLAHNIQDSERNEAVFKPFHLFEKGGTLVAVIGQAYPHLAAVHPRRFFAKWRMGIQEKELQEQVEAVRVKGARVVVVLSHNGMDVDLQLASRVTGIDVILGGHSHDVVPKPIVVDNSTGKTLVINSGSNGKFLSRLDLELGKQGLTDWAYRLLPVWARRLPPDPAMDALITEMRSPYHTTLAAAVGQSDSLLYRRSQFNGTFDDLICQALMARLDAPIAFSPGYRWGTTLLPGQEITMEAIYNQTAITYPQVYRRSMTGIQIKSFLEEAADAVFNPDPYQRQGEEMVRVGGLQFWIDPDAAMGRRVHSLTLANGRVLEPERAYQVAGWASLEEVEGQPVWEVVRDHVKDKKVIRVEPSQAIQMAVKKS
ncbi:MAG: thiosulfohydrolase SoxB [Magnetococcales bacterium]|nr:thiosulfohydrolase SoxB [Magnetococcales bacterium]